MAKQQIQQNGNGHQTHGAVSTTESGGNTEPPVSQRFLSAKEELRIPVISIVRDSQQNSDRALSPTVRLSDEESAQVAGVVATLPSFLARDPSDEVFRELAVRAALLPYKLRLSIEDFRLNSSVSGTLQINNLPCSPSCRTAADGRLRAGSYLTDEEKLSIMLASLHGTVFSYKDEKGGDIPARISPVPGSDAEQTNGSSKSRFGWHTENLSKGRLQPHGILLFCVKPDPERQAETTTASVREAISKLSGPSIRVLRREEFLVQAPISFSSNAESSLTSVLIGPENSPRLAYHETRMRPADPANKAAHAALEELLEKLNSVARGVKLDSGSALLIDNHVATHARGEFHAYFDGEDRLLLRVYTTNDWSHVREHCLNGTRLVVTSELDHA